MPSKRNMKNCTLVEIIQPKNYMTLVNEKLDYDTKQLIFDYILQDQEQSTHKELMSWKNKLRMWYCGNCTLNNIRVMKHSKTFETLFGNMSEKRAKEILKDKMK